MTSLQVPSFISQVDQKSPANHFGQLIFFTQNRYKPPLNLHPRLVFAYCTIISCTVPGCPTFLTRDS